jgi:hypothetical protein
MVRPDLMDWAEATGASHAAAIATTAEAKARVRFMWVLL